MKSFSVMASGRQRIGYSLEIDRQMATDKRFV
jgi:hypothetical protein